MNCRVLILFTLVLLSAMDTYGNAGKGPGGGRNSSGEGSGRSQMGRSGGVVRQFSSASVEALDRFLAMSDDELAAIEQTIQRIRAMSPEERAAYRNKVREYYQLPETEQERIQVAWGQLDNRLREQWRTFMQSLGEKERLELQTQLRAIEPENKVAWRLKTLREAGYVVKDPE
jgi:hypothetical protein